MTNLEGLVIAERSTGETGKTVTLLTRKLGCIDVYVRGGQKSNKSLSSTQLFCYADYSLEEKCDARGVLRFYYNSSEPKRLFYNIRLDAKKLALACYFAEIMLFAVPFGQDSENVMRLTLNTLHYLDNGERDEALLKCIFELRLLCETGFLPNLLCCSKCCKVEDDAMHLNLATGDLTCSNCADGEEGLYDFVMDKSLLYIVRYISLVEYERLFNIRVSQKYLERLDSFTEGFVQYHYGKKFKRLGFYKML